jgi:addiction module HigA family antidote
MAKIAEYKVTKPMHKPAHPGEMLQEIVVQGLQMKVSDAAKKLGVDRTTLSRLMHGHIAVSIEMALRLAKALNTTPQFWLNMQQNYDLAQIQTQNLDLSRVGRLSADGYALA